MNELALFGGAGGGLLASILSGWQTVCAVEINVHCRDTLIARQEDGHLSPFPIWGDVRTFDGKPWRGLVDVVSGGFPCQPFSSAARGRNVAQDLWPEMHRIVREVEPRYVFAENVQRRPIEQAAFDLACDGYEVRIAEIPAAILGAPHLRRRWWLAANADSQSESRCEVDEEVASLCELPGLATWSEDISRDLGMVHGLANRMDRLHALGNGQVAAVAAVAWDILR